MSRKYNRPTTPSNTFGTTANSVINNPVINASVSSEIADLLEVSSTSNDEQVTLSEQMSALKTQLADFEKRLDELVIEHNNLDEIVVELVKEGVERDTIISDIQEYIALDMATAPESELNPYPEINPDPALVQSVLALRAKGTCFSEGNITSLENGRYRVDNLLFTSEELKYLITPHPKAPKTLPIA